MSSPRDRDRDGFDDGAGGQWQEPAHLGGDPAGDGGPGPAAPRPDHDGPDQPGPDQTGGERSGSQAWQPPGWDLPSVEPERPAAASPPPPATRDQATRDQAAWPPPGDQRYPDAPPTEQSDRPRRGLGGLFGGGRSRPADDIGAGRPDVPPDPALAADPFGTQAWAQQYGWVLSDGTAPEDEPLGALVRSAPVRPGKEDQASRVVRGRGNGLDLVAFDIVSPVGRGFVSTHAITAAPVLGGVPAFRLSPARMWRHGTGGMLQIPSTDPEFDRRWVLLAAEDGPQVRRIAEDPVVRQSLLGSDDGDEVWSAAGFVAAIRPDANRPQLIEHHARLLAAVVGALAAAA
ncbi:hypothetical protein GCM10023328_07690 [Modestobacter marinus]|uniref:Uncharacterized protein n=1 Tax=Modestobacter marinus TaxID=477641 RepID=A0A846LWR3_9ACTN|nr:hypothetical protein [Modestobacter marinus]NIH66810.1 hypothetical protein [Modestobacter marinus]GGL49321.1 hypothetical protein GCM10011589_02270 [Modestobacter marinus]